MWRKQAEHVCDPRVLINIRLLINPRRAITCTPCNDRTSGCAFYCYPGVNAIHMSHSNSKIWRLYVRVKLMLYSQPVRLRDTTLYT